MAKTDVLKATRYRIEDGEGRHLYVTICFDPDVGTPYELWVTVPEENKAPQQAVRTSATMIAVLFTESRQHGAPYTKVLSAMENVIYDKSCVPARMYRLLLRHCTMEKAEMLEFEHASQRQGENNDMQQREGGLPV